MKSPPDTRIGPDDAGPIVGSSVSSSGRALDGLQEPSSSTLVEHERSATTIRRSENERDPGATLGRVGGTLVAHGVEMRDAQLMAAPTHLRRAIGLPVPADVRLDWGDLDECHV